MITYAERECFGAEHLRLLALVESLVRSVSSDWGNELRCHELVRAVHSVVHAVARDNVAVSDCEYELVVVDGHCGPVEHSWLRCADGAILDAYVPGRLPAVQIIDGNSVVCVQYRPGPPRRDIRQSIVSRLVAEMRSVALPSCSVR